MTYLLPAPRFHTLRVFSFGGGVQSTAALVLQAQGKIDFDMFVHANVGDDSEHPDTVAYMRDVPQQASLWDTYQDMDSECQTGYCGV